jgi:hypothetical protein
MPNGLQNPIPSMPKPMSEAITRNNLESQGLNFGLNTNRIKTRPLAPQESAQNPAYWQGRYEDFVKYVQDQGYNSDNLNHEAIQELWTHFAKYDEPFNIDQVVDLAYPKGYQAPEQQLQSGLDSFRQVEQKPLEMNPKQLPTNQDLTIQEGLNTFRQAEQQPLTVNPKQLPLSQDAQGINNVFSAMGNGFKEAGDKRTKKLIAENGFAEFRNPHAAKLFRDQNPNFREEVQPDGTHRFYPAEQQPLTNPNQLPVKPVNTTQVSQSNFIQQPEQPISRPATFDEMYQRMQQTAPPKQQATPLEPLQFRREKGFNPDLVPKIKNRTTEQPVNEKKSLLLPLKPVNLKSVKTDKSVHTMNKAELQGVYKELQAKKTALSSTSTTLNAKAIKNVEADMKQVEGLLMKLDLQLFGKSEPKTASPKLKAGSDPVQQASQQPKKSHQPKHLLRIQRKNMLSLKVRIKSLLKRINRKTTS